MCVCSTPLGLGSQESYCELCACPPVCVFGCSIESGVPVPGSPGKLGGFGSSAPDSDWEFRRAGGLERPVSRRSGAARRRRRRAERRAAATARAVFWAWAERTAREGAVFIQIPVGARPSTVVPDCYCYQTRPSAQNPVFLMPGIDCSAHRFLGRRLRRLRGCAACGFLTYFIGLILILTGQNVLQHRRTEQHTDRETSEQLRGGWRSLHHAVLPPCKTQRCATCWHRIRWAIWREFYRPRPSQLSRAGWRLKVAHLFSLI